jgi:hypothetical protein
MNLTLAANVERKTLGDARQITFICNNCELIGDDTIRTRFSLSSPFAAIYLPSSGKVWIDRNLRKSPQLEEFLQSPIFTSIGGSRLNFHGSKFFLARKILRISFLISKKR